MALFPPKKKSKARMKRVAGNPNRTKGKKPSRRGGGKAGSMTTAYQGGGFRNY